MKPKRIKKKSQAIRATVEVDPPNNCASAPVSWKKLLGAANQFPQTPRDEWPTDDQLGKGDIH
jgi:hypothetical protein